LPNIAVRTTSETLNLSGAQISTFPKRLPAGTALSAPDSLPPGPYIVNLAPYVPDPPSAGSDELPGAADAMPALRSVWWAGGSTQLRIDTQAKEFTSILIDEVVLNWKTLRSQIAAGTPEYPSSQAGYAYPVPPSAMLPPPNATPGYAPPPTPYPQAPSELPDIRSAPPIIPPQGNENEALPVPPRAVVPSQTPPGVRAYLLPQSGTAAEKSAKKP
jgi:hypothetical protein